MATYVPASDRYSRLDYASCGRSGLKLPRIFPGLWPLAQGLLTTKYLNGVPPTSRAAQDGSFGKSMLTDTNLANVRALNDIARSRGQSLAQMAIAWVLRNPAATKASASSWARRERDSLPATFGLHSTHSCAW
jgi:hypothetical protein